MTVGVSEPGWVWGSLVSILSLLLIQYTVMAHLTRGLGCFREIHLAHLTRGLTQLADCPPQAEIFAILNVFLTDLYWKTTDFEIKVWCT